MRSDVSTLPLVRNSNVAHGGTALENVVLGSTYAWAVLVVAITLAWKTLRDHRAKYAVDAASEVQSASSV